MKLLFFFLAFVPVVLFAQPTVLHFDDYTPGDTFAYYLCDTWWATVKGPDSGANITWDYSTVVVNDTQFCRVMAAQGSPYDTLFPAANIAIRIKEKAALYYYYFDKTSNGNYFVGLRDSILSVPVYGFRWPDTKLNAVRPASINTNNKDSFTIEQIKSPHIGEGEITWSCRGYGTLILPRDTFYDVLCLKMVNNQTDTSPGLQRTYKQQIMYVWLTDSFSTPVFKWDSIAISSSTLITRTVAFLKTPPRKTANLVPKILSSAEVSASFLNDQLQISASFTPQEYNVNVYNSSGALVYNTGHNLLGAGKQLNICNNFSPGLYIIALSRDRETNPPIIKKVVKY